MSNPTKVARLRLQAFGAVIMICGEAGLGMFVNLFVTIPRHHTGSSPSDYFSGSYHSVSWAITHGAIALVIHAVLGLLLAIMVIGIVVRSLFMGRRAIATWSIVGALFTIGAGFNGASFLDYNKNVSSFLMAILALGSILCFAVVLFIPSTTDPSGTPVEDRKSTVPVD
jgi:hypothetical protein